MENRACMAGQPEHVCQLAELAEVEAEGRPTELDLWRWRGVLEGELAEGSGRLLSI
tara:strand:- start:226 stop:393 length:168 start_codon:yes stop_codon:yes gene_type:complete